MTDNQQRAAEVTGCVIADADSRYGPPFCATHDEDGNPPWSRCRWVPVAAALDAAEARGRAEGAADELGDLVRWARFRVGTLSVAALHRECLARAAHLRALVADARLSKPIQPDLFGGAALTPEGLARLFHDTYERLAPSFGYETRRESAVPWEQVPENNRRLMVAVCAEILRRDDHAGQERKP